MCVIPDAGISTVSFFIIETIGMKIMISEKIMQNAIIIRFLLKHFDL